jgi:hypothetical protein
MMTISSFSFRVDVRGVRKADNPGKGKSRPNGDEVRDLLFRDRHRQGKRSSPDFLSGLCCFHASISGMAPKCYILTFALACVREALNKSSPAEIIRFVLILSLSCLNKTGMPLCFALLLGGGAAGHRIQSSIVFNIAQE